MLNTLRSGLNARKVLSHFRFVRRSGVLLILCYNNEFGRWYNAGVRLLSATDGR
jgi:ribosomal protein L36